MELGKQYMGQPAFTSARHGASERVRGAGNFGKDDLVVLAQWLRESDSPAPSLRSVLASTESRMGHTNPRPRQCACLRA